MVAAVRTVQYTGTAATSVEAQIVQCIAAVTGVAEALVVVVADAATTTTLQKTVTNAFTGVTTHASAVGLTGSVTLLSAHATEVGISSSSSTTTERAVATSWMHAAQQSLLPLLSGCHTQCRTEEEKGTKLSFSLSVCLRRVHLFLCTLCFHHRIGIGQRTHGRVRLLV